MIDLNLLIPVVDRKQLLLETLSSLPINNDIGTNINLKVTIVGRSGDDTVSLVKQMFGNQIDCQNEEDAGLFDGLGKHLSLIKSGYVTWLGAGDMWTPDALITIEQTIKKGYKWFMGLPIIYSNEGAIKSVFPYRNYNSKLIVEGWYDGYLPLIQQESTIWHASLHKNVDWDRFRSLQLAGDYYLWTCFAQSETLYSCDGHIGGYRIHENSLSRLFYKEYKQEIISFTNKTIIGTILAYRERVKLIANKISRIINKAKN